MNAKAILINVLSSLLLALIVAAVAGALGAPDWACFAVGAIVYLVTIGGRRRA